MDVLLRASESHGGLFPSVIDRASGRLLDENSSHLHGQRDSDRAERGSNLGRI